MLPERIASAAGRYRAWLALAAGGAASLAFAPTSLFPLGILCPAALFLLWEGATPREALRAGFAYGAGLFLAGTYWLYIAVHTFGKAPAWLAIFLMLGLVAIMAAYYALLGWLTARALPASGPARWLLAVPGAWVLTEWLRGWLFTGFPWLEAGYSQSDSPLVGLAPVGGVHAVTLACAVSAGAIVAFARGGMRDRVTAVVATVAIWAGSAALAEHPWTHVAGEPLTVALVQGAIPQDLKWQDQNREATLTLYRRMTEGVLGTRLIVWPEAALPVLEHEAVPYLSAIWTEAHARNSDLVIGLLRYDFENAKYYNGLVSLSDQSRWYYKRRLVPFGEFFPVPKVVRHWMRLMSLPYVDMSPGLESQPPLVAAGQKLGATICYEDAYGSEQLGVLAEATLLVNATNNAWFGDSTAPHQQLQMARFRAREAGRYLVRATSNGITAIIGPDGTVERQARQFVPEVLMGSVRPYTGLTPYARTGNWPVLLLSCAAFVLGLVVRRLRSG